MNRSNKEFTFFWRGPFSQWHKANMTINNVTYFCAEQYMMAAKAKVFEDYETLNKILQSTSPKEIKDLGRVVKNFKQEVWDKVKYSIVYTGNFYKFIQNYDLKTLLLNTEDSTLVEASPYDKVWGIGMSEDDPDCLDVNKWKGENLLGKAITNVRQTIKKGITIILDYQNSPTLFDIGRTNEEHKAIIDEKTCTHRFDLKYKGDTPSCNRCEICGYTEWF